MPSHRSQALLVDLDGTLYRGDGPVLAYAGAIADRLPANDSARFLSIMDTYLTSGVWEPEPDAVVDGWEAVRLLAQRFGVEPADAAEAYLVSRQALTRPDCVVETPVGLLSALRALRADTYVVLATNSPRDWLGELLARLGAADAFDETVPSARKPIGMPGILLGLAGRVGITDQPWRVFSVGDHWRNDIAPARAFGAVTGYVDRFGRDDRPADVVATDVEGVLPTILRWAADPDAFRPVPTH